LEQRKEHIGCEEKKKGCKVQRIKNEDETENDIRGDEEEDCVKALS
jgi:hypothetical protein